MQPEMTDRKLPSASDVPAGDKTTLAPIWLDRLTDRLVQLQRIVSDWVLILMTLAIAAEVVCRSFLGFSLLVVEELAGYMLLALVFLGMGIATQENSLFRVEFVIESLPAKVAEFCLLVFRVLCVGFVLILLDQMVRLVSDSYTRGVSAATTLATPLYIPQIVMVLGAGTLLLVLVTQIVRSVRQILRSGS